MRHHEANAKNNEHQAFEALLERYRNLLYRICMRYSGREVTVEDLMQELSIALWQQRERLQALPSGVRQAGWVWRVASNAAIDVVRKTPGHERAEGNELVGVPAEEKGLVVELYEQIALLEEDEQKLVRMQLEGYRYEEIASAAGISVKNVSVKLVRIKEKLRQRMSH